MVRTEVDFTGTERFEVKRRLGAGGMGVVYEAFDRERKQLVALKTLKRFDADALFRFKKEFRALNDIDHPNLISLYELCDDGGECFFTMELVRGVDFLSHVRGADFPASADDEPQSGDVPSREPAPTPTAATDVQRMGRADVSPSQDTLRAEKIAQQMSDPACSSYDEAKLRAALKQLALGVAALHSAGKVHRDIKPSNILVTEDGRVVLLDFGLVTQTSKEGQSTQASVVGTAEYMAPEQAVSGDVGPAADWYSVGVVLYESLTARLPHSGKTPLELLMKKQNKIPAPPRQRVPDLPKDLDALCVELLSIEPRQRPDALGVFESLGIDADTVVSKRSTTNTGFTQTTPFIGREQELATLATAFEDSRSKPVIVVVEGESGLGKSELVRHFTKNLVAERPEVVVFAGRCYERESVAYKAFDGMIDELSRYMARLPKVDAAVLMPMQAGLLPRLFPVLQRVEAIAGAPREPTLPDPQEMRRQMFAALRELLLRLTKHRPLVLVIDDLQWTDTDSLILLQELLGEATSPNLLLIATMRPMESEERARIFASVRGLDQRRIDLTAFSWERAKELAKTLLPSFDDDALGVIAREAAGHPLFVMELARYVHDQGHGQEVTLDQVLWHRIQSLPGTLLRLLEFLCVAGAPLAQETIASAAEMQPAELAKAASVLRIAYLARTSGVRKDNLIEPYHDRIREIVTAHLSPAILKHCHHRLALALERAGAAETSPQALVRHAEAAGELERAATYAEAAARHAIAAMAFSKAAEFFQISLRLGDYGEDKARALRLALAEAFVNAGRGPDAARVFTLAAVGADPATRLDCQRQAAEQWIASGHIAEGLAAIEKVLGEVGATLPATPARAVTHLLWNRFRLRLRGRKFTRRHQSEIAATELLHIDIYKAVGVTLSMADNIRASDFNARQLRLALRSGEPVRVGRALATEVGFLASNGRRTRANELAAEVAELADSMGNDLLRGWSAAAQGFVAYFAGDFAAADRVFGQAEVLFRDRALGTVWEQNTVRLFQLFCRNFQGSLSKLHELVAEMLQDAARRGDRYTETSARYLGHASWLCRGDPDRALSEVDGAPWQVPKGLFHLQHWYEIEARGEIALYEGQASGALVELAPSFQALEKSLLLRIRIVRASFLWLRSRLLLAAASSAQRPAPLRAQARRLTRRLARERLGPARGWASLLGAAWHQQAGDSARAIAELRAAIEIAEAHKLGSINAVANRRLSELLGGDESAEHLTRSNEWVGEERVADPARMTEVYAPGFGEP